MRPGARLVVLTMALDEAGSFGNAPLLAALCDILLVMEAEGFNAVQLLIMT